HVKASNHALERFGLAQVVRNEHDLGPALERALAHRPEPDPSFARRPSTASLMLSNERRAGALPRWRLRAARAVTGSVAVLLLAAWTLTAGASYSLMSQFVHMRAITSVPVSRPEVGLLLDVPAADIPALADGLRRHHVAASFALSRVPNAADLRVLRGGDQAIPRLGHGGLVRWLETGDQLHRLTRPLGFAGQHGFLYASSGPSVGQWFLAHSAGGRLVGGAVRLSDVGDAATRFRAGEVIEVSVTNPQTARIVVDRLCRRLNQEHLRAVSLSKLWHDAGVSV
ncbi:MAG TPA: hypothetical protein VE983_08405, partial [Solirubrobacteraceae bacterium]|nr:hypothetical protein [Solirubrobacteraceae bacterium]